MLLAGILRKVRSNPARLLAFESLAETRPARRSGRGYTGPQQLGVGRAFSLPRDFSPGLLYRDPHIPDRLPPLPKIFAQTALDNRPHAGGYPILNTG
jgi:hypothetical protein